MEIFITIVHPRGIEDGVMKEVLEGEAVGREGWRGEALQGRGAEGRGSMLMCRITGRPTARQGRRRGRRQEERQVRGKDKDIGRGREMRPR